ncbi:(2Fe-2S)-binding protein [Lutibacter maritimus]|jgi:isoquinoline 1-oxidoreductase alpha subunit|uniref:Isoquinoline 1-oxidoreductase, alpha subunit n=1 Tax=Lutibacter maritimus TaxID=593133 RepID=A0A1I6SA26_9FLAO|nr:(2Fe-2S)-binding protein [Lutibacter maritimus]SFS73763.1 isoquinoline 1-oxidoreductase, alpha subunit [Lutibacter maritimus]
MITLQINGKSYAIDVEPDMPLLWAIRDVVGLTGTKYSCGIGVCGSCKVLLDNSPVQSCMIPVSAAEGKSIITVEGTSKNLQLLQDSWMELNVPQCGFCQPGQLIAATALLDKNPNPTDEEIDEAMIGNICRCGTYQRIKNAINRTVNLNKQS